MKMNLKNSKILINLEAIQSGELQYFFKPFMWQQVKYKLFLNNDYLKISKNVHIDIDTVTGDRTSIIKQYQNHSEKLNNSEINLSQINAIDKSHLNITAIPTINESSPPNREVDVLPTYEETLINEPEISAQLNEESLLNAKQEKSIEKTDLIKEAENHEKEISLETEDNASETKENTMNDILASYKNIARKYKS
ncbi:hypothetical protein B9T31_16545 [Acinetobacter sp. ANC 4558]|uniref:hypothetical protein n=1 Tax=Acinetobacter sp. ANC 4558 TaxID=1977876 RepID=UPI000A33BD1D|nr:hypothetical protein [Acinetobacter sp. ANC 4558]OTG79849.1 hypothetical protein B9T31_16545 [Acinetobacter sp. ANC 4558]